MARVVIDTSELHGYTDAEILSTWQLLNQHFEREMTYRLLGVGARNTDAEAETETEGEMIENWRTVYTSAIEHVKNVWTAPSGHGWATADVPPSGNEIVAIMKSARFGRWTSKAVAMNIQKVIIADRDELVDAEDHVREPEEDLERWRDYYAQQIDDVQQYVDHVDGRPGAWRTRRDRISCRHISDATGLTGKATVLKIRRAVESMSDRGPVPPPAERDYTRGTWRYETYAG